ncbi:MAG: hypothetical protein IPH07_38740 [Deltaproteobacteria bacterium]|nr:hypothetical protein [Deltaproteobacteria bacterium]MBK8713771.1 hypothetical protein [Deltaproteobacteria bacterium]MBP7290280.1 hypothetical protein [Nannocystaceae bacterium]
MIERLDDARWRAAIDAAAIDEADAVQQALVATHVPGDAAARLEHALLAELRVAIDAPTTATVDDEIAIAAAVEQALPRRPTRWLAPTLAAAAAVVLLSLAWWQPWSPASELAPLEPWATPLAQWQPTDAAAPAPTPLPSTDPGWILDRGAIDVAAGPLPPGITTRARTEACAREGETRVCVTAGSEFVVQAPAEGSSFTLADGEARVHTATTIAHLRPVIVAGVRVVLEAESEVVLQVHERRWAIDVVRGRAAITRDDHDVVTLRAGERLAADAAETSIRPDRPRSEPAANELLTRARALRAEGDLGGAAQAYERLVDAHPRSALALAALLSLGEVQLERGRARAALAAFDRYLRRKGSLAEEASFGRIRALRALDRDADADAATAAFLRRWPRSAYAAKLRSP